MSKEYTTIRVTKDAKNDAEESKREDETWNDYIRRCTENPPELREFVDAEAGGSLGYDDVVAGCRKAIRDELPDEVLRQ